MRTFKWILGILLLAGGALLCTIRWQAWFGNPVEPVYEGDTLTYRFWTFGADSVPGFQLSSDGWRDISDPDTLRIVIFGDVHNQVDSTQYASIWNRHNAIDAYAQLGDWMERSYFYYEQHLYHQINQTGWENVPVINCPGNHEYRKGIRKTLPEQWYRMFHHPLNGPNRFLGTTYYVDFPRLRFIVIDSNGLQRLSDFTIVQTWLTRAIHSAGNRYTAVMMHHPVYSSGKGRFNPGMWLFFHTILHKADVVFAGHDHCYARRGHFINTNSSAKSYKRKYYMPVSTKHTHNLYELMEVTDDALRVKTYSIVDSILVDEWVLERPLIAAEQSE